MIVISYSADFSETQLCINIEDPPLTDNDQNMKRE
jgi:hypothetical protein